MFSLYSAYHANSEWWTSVVSTHSHTTWSGPPHTHTHSLLSSGVLAGVGHALRVNLWNPPSAAQQHLALLCNTSPWAVRGLVIGVWPRMGNELWLACSLGRLTPTTLSTHPEMRASHSFSRLSDLKIEFCFDLPRRLPMKYLWVHAGSCAMIELCSSWATVLPTSICADITQ